MEANEEYGNVPGAGDPPAPTETFPDAGGDAPSGAPEGDDAPAPAEEPAPAEPTPGEEPAPAEPTPGEEPAPAEPDGGSGEPSGAEPSGE